ncbi:related to monocarboxylate transporter 4 [Ramularia collo-cygni]|uniref:Related to monocarboxylate transporter 4 n=1 Tax=Ramularia collo-cygni TaxID=112498 RepID=A0A2D3UZ62_9PEZI|nr:related to monocarboxylate transporter 4 [Ramularia collo-cygni]CZT20768.1 related to monocarboxylate transporter 4 [Ramularia collo-cygni]
MSAHHTEPHEDAEKLSIHMIRSVGSGRSSHEFREDRDAVGHASSQGDDESISRPSTDLKRTASNVLSKVASRLTTRSIPEPPPPPDGGLHAWTQVACGWIVILCTWGAVNSFGVFQTYYTVSLKLDPSTVSWIGSVQNFLTFFIGALSGRLLDAGYFTPCFLVGSIIQVVGIFCMSLSTKYWQLMLSQGVMSGIGGGIIFTPAMGLVGSYFSKKRALAIGLATTGNSVGGMVYPVMVQQLLPKIGFAWTARCLGFFNLAMLCIAIAFMRPRLPPRKSGPYVDLSAFKEPTYAFLIAGLFFAFWAVYWTYYYLSPYGVDVIGMPFSAAATITIVLNGAGLPFRILPPLLADRYGPLNVMAPVMFLLTVVAFCFLPVKTPAGLYTYAVVYGCASSAFQCIVPSTVASITTDMTKFGTRLGMAFGTLSFAALTGPPIGGALQIQGGYVGAILWAAASTMICAGLVLASRITRMGWHFRSKT